MLNTVNIVGKRFVVVSKPEWRGVIIGAPVLITYTADHSVPVLYDNGCLGSITLRTIKLTEYCPTGKNLSWWQKQTILADDKRALYEVTK